MPAHWIVRVPTPLAILTLLLAAGCSKPPYDLAPVRGKVTIANQPLAGGKVLFAPLAREGAGDAGKPAFGRTDSDGMFELTTYKNGDGAIIGEHWVTVFVPKREIPAAGPGVEPVSNEVSYKRRAVPQKQIVSADQDNVINIAL